MLLAAGLLASLLCASCDSGTPGAGSSAAEKVSSTEETIRRVVASEELILLLQPGFKPLKQGIVEGIPLDRAASALFEDGGALPAGQFAELTSDAAEIGNASARGDDFTSVEQTTDRIGSLGLAIRHMSAPADDSEQARAMTTRSLWPPGLGEIRMRHAKFAIVRGRFLDDTLTRFETDVAFEGHGAVAADGRVVAVESNHRVEWAPRDASAGAVDDAGWRIRRWQPIDARVSVLASPQPLFEDVRHSAFPDPALLGRLTVSEHRRILLENYFGGKPASLPPGYSDSRFYPDSVNTHDALSVVDIDGDGWDDLYVCVRWGRNLLLRNRGDGTFEDVAPRLGLDVDGRNTSATFADFDNDGDPDLVLGRSLERSIYFENADGRFVPRPDAAPSGGFPFLVTSTSAADFDNDGLLDLYFCTYSPLDINTRTASSAQADAMAPDWARQFLPADQADEVVRRNASAHGYLGQVGPPNVLLVNRGGRFEHAPGGNVLAGWRNSFQASWADHDDDGDQDLFLANDFAPDAFYRNDGADGFTDVTAACGLDRMGFGMGAGWGDYDNDGALDLYVSNMYSKAGRRITSGIPGLDERFRASADGNYLYRQDPSTRRFTLVSGTEPPAIPVARAGWSWGGQFADFDNDGRLDLYVSSGFYTAPDEVANEVDL